MKQLNRAFARLILLAVFFSQTMIAFCQSGKEVRLKENANTLEITNGLLGIVLPKETTYDKNFPAPAPIQSFIYKDGQRSDDSKNLLSSPTPAISMKVSVVTKRPDNVTVKLEYKFDKREFSYGKTKFKGGEAGPGFYRCIISVKKGEKTVLIEEDANYDISYDVDISEGLFPDKARYRGWSSTGIEYGYETPGKLYRSELERGSPSDATLDIQYNKSVKYPRLVLWEPAGGEQNSGRYWMVFNSQSPRNANLLGFFHGQPSRLIGGRSIGVRLQTYPKEIGSNQREKAALNISIERRGPDNIWYARKRFQWVIFIGTKEDVLEPQKQQPIANEMNKVSGLGKVIEGYASRPVKLVPAFYQGAIYMPGADIKDICKRIKYDLRLYNLLCTVDPGYKKIWDAWRFSDSATTLKHFLIETADQLKRQYIIGDGTYAREYRYWMGSNLFKYYALTVSALFADGSIKINREEKKRLEQFVGMMARIVWDDNNVPLFDSAGVNMGPANMPFMYGNNGRFFFALLLADDPEFKGRVKNLVTSVEKDIDNAIYSNGSSFGTPHYTQPTIDPLLFSILQLKNSSGIDFFKLNPKIAAFARFYMMLLTPPSVRFMKNRKLISFGDGSEESAVTFALLGVGLKNIDPGLSKELISVYHHGPKRGTTFGPIGLTINLEVFTEEKELTITSANYSGYVSHFRTAINTANESALWVLNGEGLYDHRNDDAGEVAIYALQAPLSLSRSSFYYPSATDSRVRSVVVPEKNFPEWNKSEQPIAARSLTNRVWEKSEVLSYTSMANSASAGIKMQTKNEQQWYRRITMINIYPELPIFIFYDSVTGNEKNIWSITMMSDRNVSTPRGYVNPEKRIYNNKDLKQLPGATAEYELTKGLNEFSFIGQSWKAHATNGINWKLFTISDVPINFTLSNWSTTWQNTIEIGEFLKTNGRNYSEEQQILRLQSDKPFFNVILPFAKGDEPYANNEVQYLSDRLIRIKQRHKEIIISPTVYYAKAEHSFSAALLSDDAHLAVDGYELSGGSIELDVTENSVKIRLHGGSGQRKIILPFLLKIQEKHQSLSWEEVAGKTLLTLDYTAGNLDLKNGDVGYKEIEFQKK